MKHTWARHIRTGRSGPRRSLAAAASAAAVSPVFTGVEQCVNRTCVCVCVCVCVSTAAGPVVSVMELLCWAGLITGEQRAPVWASKWRHMFSQTNRLNETPFTLIQDAPCVWESLAHIKPLTPPPHIKLSRLWFTPLGPPRILSFLFGFNHLQLTHTLMSPVKWTDGFSG